MRNRVLIVENQFVQYELMTNCLLKKGYIISPSGRDEYTSLISAVKVYINESGYSVDYREACFDVIKKFCLPEKESPVDLIIMDYKLGGSTVCRTGYDLAIDIWKKVDKNIPVLFLSRTDYSEEYGFEQRREMECSSYHFDWLMKGFLGEETMQCLFVEKTVCGKMEQLLSKEWPAVPCVNQFIIDMINKLLSLSVMARYDMDSFKEMKNYFLNRTEKIDEESLFVKELRKRVSENRATVRGELESYYKDIHNEN